MFRRCPKAFHNNYNCINHIGVIYSQYPFGDTLSKKPASCPNQSEDDFEIFCNNFELTVDAVLATNLF